MADPQGVPIIESSPLGVMGLNLSVAFDVDPELFPDGVELIAMAAGRLQPVGRIVAARGALLVALPLDMAAKLRAEHRKQLEAAKRKLANGAG